MQTFTINADNNIAAYSKPQDAANAIAAGAAKFTSLKEFQKIAANWPGSRLVEIWNSFAGVAPFSDLKSVTKFESRDKAVRRIWIAVQKLIPFAEKRWASDADLRSVSAASEAEIVGSEKREREAPRTGSKSTIILSMIKNGATLKELMAAAGWQAHSVRGFLSTAAKKQGIKIESTRTKEGERFYKLVK